MVTLMILFGAHHLGYLVPHVQILNMILKLSAACSQNHVVVLQCCSVVVLYMEVIPEPITMSDHIKRFLDDPQ